VGRPREHDETTRESLRVEAERIVAEHGLAALSIRAVADAAHTTTRAVYSTFGSKDGLIDALAQTAFEFLYTEIEKLPETNDPIRDAIDVAVKVFRRLVLDHPVLYRIAFQRVAPGLPAGPDVTAARQRAFAQLQGKIRRLEKAGLLGRTSLEEATVAIEAIMEGLANAELRGHTLPILPAGEERQAWRRALTTLIRGFSASGDYQATDRDR
jgi:AcrR family transcriptional regulator